MYSDYFKYLEKIKGDILPFPNSAWPTEADVPLGVVVNDGGVIKQSQAGSSFDGGGFADFPSQFDISDGIPWELECDLNMTYTDSNQNFIGDNESSADRIRCSATLTSLTFTTSGDLTWGGSTIQGEGRVTINFVCDGNRNVEYFINSVSQGVRTTSDSAISFDNFGMGFNAPSFNFVGDYYSTKLTINGSLVLDHKPTSGDTFVDSITGQKIPPSGIGTTFFSYLVPV